MSNKVPVYTETDHDLPPGLYLGLMHGRDTKDAVLDDWGFNGPTLGPLKYCHVTYGQHYKLQFLDESRAREVYGINTDGGFVDVVLTDDLFPWAGKYYGDWTSYTVAAAPPDNNNME